jgi:alkyl sulfatase BDS1-like metallo-beta-lactamase superfamily hydrolase
MEPTEPQPATEHTRALQRRAADALPHDDGRDTERVQRGFLGTLTDPVIPNDSASSSWAPVTWDVSRWSFIEGDAPDSVHPSLWRHAKLNGAHGLFEVMDGVFQVRSLDTSNVTFIRGDRGWVVVDPLTTSETARAALGLVTEHLGERPVTAVIYTHSHVDHYGGILGVVSAEEIAAGAVDIIAPEGFLEAAVGENVAAGAAMGRRATYQYGMLLPWSERGHVDQGLSKGVPAGAASMVPPTREITRTGEELVLDGVRIVFQLTPDTEAPAEMHFWFPDLKLLCLAENCTGTMHNVITLRGAIVRDALQWSRYIDEAIDTWGDQVEVSFASHSWPRWGRDDVIDHMTRQRDMYRWIHDEAMRHANLGATPDEIAEVVSLPPGLWDDWACHGYYGTLSHNVRAVYQRYLGWYDGHPSSLSPYPPVESARRYVEFMGGIDALVENAQRSFDEGDYRWVAQVLRHAVFAEPGHRHARELQALAFEQLGYQSESGPWRDVYLMGAQELRHGTMPAEFPFRPGPHAAAEMTLTQVFDYLAIRLDGPALAELGDFQLDWHVSDMDEDVRLTVSNGTLHGVLGRRAVAPVATIRSPRAALDRMIAFGTSVDDLVAEGLVTIEGDADRVTSLWSLLVDFPLFFPIVEP